MSVEVVKSYLNKDCGCPEQELVIGMAVVIIHLEPDGTGDAFIDMGEWQSEEIFDCTTMDELKEKVTNHINSLPVDE